jgi:predicted Zn-ribbon and HTH transcriptional regulator
MHSLLHSISQFLNKKKEEMRSHLNASQYLLHQFRRLLRAESPACTSLGWSEAQAQVHHPLNVEACKAVALLIT